MANRERGEVSLGEYTLVFSIDAVCQIEDAAGKSWLSIIMSLNDVETLTMKTMRVLLWGALRERHPSLSLIDAGNLIRKFKAVQVMSKLTEAIQAFNAEPDEDAAPASPPG
jgi:hypothetical protein